MHLFNYLARYRRTEIKSALKVPLNNEHVEKSDLIKNKSQLFHINTSQSSFARKSLAYYLNQDKFKILSDKKYKSKDFTEYSKLNQKNFKTKSKYEIGLKTDTMEWLLDIFKNISLTNSYLKMFKIVEDNIKKLI